jgi:hypothetical protein
MYDYFRSSYELGEQFTEVTCQTKDMEKGLGGSMSHYWLDPSGKLWTMTYNETHAFEIIEEDDSRYDPKLKFLNFEWIPTGKHGKVEPYCITDYVEVYPSGWKGNWEDWPRCRIHFVKGILQSYEEITKKDSINMAISSKVSG